MEKHKFSHRVRFALQFLTGFLNHVNKRLISLTLFQFTPLHEAQDASNTSLLKTEHYLHFPHDMEIGSLVRILMILTILWFYDPD